MNELDELTRFREATTGDPAARVRARNRLVSRILSNQPPPPRIPSRRTLTRRVLVATAAVAVAAGGVIVADSLRVADRPVGATAEAATLLNQAADGAIGSTDLVVGPDEYLHVTSVEQRSLTVGTGQPDEPGWLYTYTRETFVPGDPAKEWVSRQSPSVPNRPEDAELAAQHGFVYPWGGGTQRRPAPAGVRNWDDPSLELLATLPRDPEQLLERIRHDASDAGPSRDGQALVLISDILSSGIVPGDLRAALFQTAALIPGVEVTDEQANLNGRIGVAVGRYEANWGTRPEIIFDPETGLVIGQREVLVDYGHGPLVPVGSAASWTAVTTDVVPASMVDEIPADPTE